MKKNSFAFVSGPLALMSLFVRKYQYYVNASLTKESMANVPFVHFVWNTLLINCAFIIFFLCQRQTTELYHYIPLTTDGSVILFIRSVFIRSLFIRPLFIRSLFIRSFLYGTFFIRFTFYTVHFLYGSLFMRSFFIWSFFYTAQFYEKV
jgi:hypothetical protein